MTAYTPNPVVTIGGVDFTADTINLVQITGGRSSIDDQPRAGYATVSLIVLDGTYPSIALNALLRVSVADSTGNDPHIFTGYITDIVRRMAASGNVGNAIQIDITAAGPLSRLAKFLTNDTYSKQYDGDRITAILQDVFTTSWNEVTPTTLTWNGVGPTVEWQTYDPGYVGSVETPGDFELYAYSGGEVEALSLTRLVANSALGILYETGDGLINYDASTTRIDRVAASGFTEIDADYLASLSMAADSRTADLINQITITYKANASTTALDTDSVATYGLFAASRSTYLEQAAQAQQQRDFYLETRAIPRVNLGQIQIPLHNPNLPDALRDDLLGVFCGLPIAVSDLPTAIYNHPFTGFVEGYSWRVTRNTAELSLTVSDYGLTAIQQAWEQVNAAERWNTLSPALIWADARTVY